MRFRIFNKITLEWWEGEAASAQEACRRVSWNRDVCVVKEYSPIGSGGWKLVKELWRPRTGQKIRRRILAAAEGKKEAKKRKIKRDKWINKTGRIPSVVAPDR